MRNDFTIPLPSSCGNCGHFRTVTVTYDYRSDPILGGALAYWREKRGSRSMPRRRDIDPVEVPTLLPHLQLIEIVAGGRFRYRLIGTALVEAFGRDYTGQYPDVLFDGQRGKITEVYSAVRDAKQPLFLRSRYLTTKEIDLVANRLYVPLSEDDSHVNMILGILTFDFGTIAAVAGEWGSARLAPDGGEAEIVDADSA